MPVLRTVAALAVSAAVLAAPASADASVDAAPSSTVTVLPSALPGPDYSVDYDAVSCAGEGDCLAIGDQYQTIAATAAAHLSAGSWVPTTLAAPANTLDAYAEAVSCPTTTWCAALITAHRTTTASAPGDYVAIYDGDWGAPVRVGPQYSFSGITCSAPGSCASRSDDGDQFLTLADRRWSATPVSSLADRSVSAISASSCSADGSCTAIGTDGGELAALSRTGGQWSVTDTTLPTGWTTLAIGSLSCTSAAYCVGAGSAIVSAAVVPVAIVLEGGTWSFDQLPAAGTHLPTAVSCSAIGSCAVLVPDYDTGTANSVDVLDGSAWSTAPLPSTSSGYTPAGGISCSGSTCLVVGYGQAWRAELAGSATTWTDTGAMPGPNPPDIAVDGVACPAVGTCTALGVATEPGGQQQLVTYTRAANTWRESTVSAKSFDAGTPAGIACPAGGRCVGTLLHGGSTPRTLAAEVERGSSWTEERLPLPSGAAPGPFNPVSAPSCPSTTRCAAAVSYNGPGQLQSGHVGVETWSGTTWAFTALPIPIPVPGASVNTVLSAQVSCATPTWCALLADVQYNQYEGNGGEDRFVAETLIDGRWTATFLPLSQFDGARVNSIDCPAVGWCVAVGADAGNVSQYFAPWVQVLSGGTWHAQSLPLASDVHNQELQSVTCVAVQACVAAGYQSVQPPQGLPGIRPYHPLLASLSGSTWTRTVPAEGPSTVLSQLSAVGCAPAGNCIALGEAASTDGGSHPIGIGVTPPAPRPASHLILRGDGAGRAVLTWVNPLGASGSDVTLSGCVTHAARRSVPAATRSITFTGLRAGHACTASVTGFAGSRASARTTTHATSTGLTISAPRTVHLAANGRASIIVRVHGAPHATGWRITLAVRIAGSRTVLHRVTLDRREDAQLTVTVHAIASVNVQASYPGGVSVLGSASRTADVRVLAH